MIRERDYMDAIYGAKGGGNIRADQASFWRDRLGRGEAQRVDQELDRGKVRGKALGEDLGFAGGIERGVERHTNLGDVSLSRQESYSENRFADLLNGAIDIATNIMSPGLGSIDNFSSLMQQQMFWQIEMQHYSAESNLLKSKHEVAMAPIRNLRVG